jgi:hypothetical protein
MASVARSRRPWMPAALTVLVGFQAISGLFGGAALVADPSGGVLGLPLSALRRGPFLDFLVPGAILLLVFGVLPAFVAVGLWRRPRWGALAPLERPFGEHWSWVGAGVVGVGLVVWLAVELWAVGPSSLLVLYALVAVAILVLALMPSVRRFYRA